LAELWRRGEEGGEVVGDGVEMFDICVTQQERHWLYENVPLHDPKTV
jgi:hypothetical protein